MCVLQTYKKQRRQQSPYRDKDVNAILGNAIGIFMLP